MKSKWITHWQLLKMDIIWWWLNTFFSLAVRKTATHDWTIFTFNSQRTQFYKFSSHSRISLLLFHRIKLINYVHHKTVWQWSRIKHGYGNCLYLIENSSFFWSFFLLVFSFIYGERLYWVRYLEQIASTETLQYGTRSQTEHRLLDWLWC